ncbi:MULTISPECIES: sugar ABC transporter ATP-binding protein [unclassified Ruegeria]|uniref:sugar ABC transporter ATP-binding protein n=1 Tax=unclassified Ruegeria TaxID=2625375 RepID=UPI0014891129|nr:MULTISPECIES: sugar ABC transporter ATP-binding protein [unclassified Ruegeria]NOD77662.1 ATP-binding cassette domain-containing protein [Ruegeria sp. HKCCD4332]NOD89869.1 ATP-binding cassette domain-containing protein [Ruegeria sp. HKCCD4318]NOE14685.1 ATP-binding cassette domain-containing protein [Ruegeria sp. HKCCD4318-2]NOG10961.1 sugar ABC transporter ATP-binding protein [Ruegeria sp. HKCCD4315]
MKTDPDTAPALRLRNVSKTFGGVKALQSVDFEVRPGEVHCLAGENGCGKSTLIKIVTGVYTADPGAELELFGHSFTTISPTKARALGIAVIWQDLALFPHMTVAENIAFDEMVGLIPRLNFGSHYRRHVQSVLDRLHVPLNLDTRLGDLPIAQRQIVAIARALMGEARLVFMDEPTASLTQTETDALLEVVRTLSSQGIAVVFVSHRLAEVIDISERVTVLRDGKLVGVYSTENMTQSRLGELMTGALLEHTVNAQDRAQAEPVLEVQGMCRHGEFQNVSLTIRRGEVLGLTGLIGAGRTELAHALIGMNPLDVGEIRLEGTPVRFASIREAIARGVAYVSEDRLSLGLIQPQSIADNTAISVLDRILNGLGLLSPKRQSDLVGHWIRELAVKIGRPEDAVSTLSGGNQQRVVLAKWLATEPRLLILDSPTVGVDVGARAGIFKIVRQLADEGLAILLISDEVTEAMFNSDRVLHMADGQIVGEYDPRTTSVSELEARIYA